VLKAAEESTRVSDKEAEETGSEGIGGEPDVTEEETLSCS